MYRVTAPSVGCPRAGCLYQSSVCRIRCSNMFLHRGFASLHPFWGRSGFVYTSVLWRVCTLLRIACFSLKLSYPRGGGTGPLDHASIGLACFHGRPWLSALLCLRSKGSRCFSGAFDVARSLIRSPGEERSACIATVIQCVDGRSWLVCCLPVASVACSDITHDVVE